MPNVSSDAIRISGSILPHSRQTSVEGWSRDAQKGGGSALVIAGPQQGLLDVQPLRLLQSRESSFHAYVLRCLFSYLLSSLHGSDLLRLDGLAEALHRQHCPGFMSRHSIEDHRP